MTGNGEQEQAAELAKQVEALREQGPPIFRAVQQYIAAARPADAGAAQGPPSLGRQVSEAMDLEMADVIAAVQRAGAANLAAEARLFADHLAPVSASASLAAEATIRASGRVIIAKPRVAAFGDVGTATDSLSVVKLEDIGKLTTRARRDGIAGLSTMHVLALVLVWLLAAGVPVVQQALPPEAQALLSDEYGTIGLAFAITLVIVQNRKR